MSSGLEGLIELGRQGLLRQKSWSIRDHYKVQASFWLPEDFRARFGEVWVVLAGGNLVVPNLARVRVNGFPVDYLPDPARSTSARWESERAWDDRVRLRFPLGVLTPGENTVQVSTHMLPGLARVISIEEMHSMHNMSLASIGVWIRPRRK